MSDLPALAKRITGRHTLSGRKILAVNLRGSTFHVIFDGGVSITTDNLREWTEAHVDIEARGADETKGMGA